MGSSTSDDTLRYLELSNFFLTAVSFLLEAVMHSLATLPARVLQISISQSGSNPEYSNRISG